MNRRILLVGGCFCLHLAASCAEPPRGNADPRNAAVESRIVPPKPDDPEPVELPGVHNVVAFAPGLFSGSAPVGDAGFDSLVALGVRTIISVDGAQPEVEKAKAHGLRYVHLPIGYDGMSHERELELARAAKELPGPIFVHCHHGKHRSAGATGVIAVMLGLRTNDEALERMHVAKTSASYPGLFRCTEQARPVDANELRLASAAFPERWRTTGLVQGMVEIDDAMDHLKAIEKAGWKTPADHPDLVPAAEAGRLADLFRTLPDDPTCAARPAEFRERLLAESRKADRLESGLVAWDVSARELSERLGELTSGCTSCHAAYRNSTRRAARTPP